MDRCRCPEYKEAVKNMRFYTVGTLRPDIIENYDRSKFVVVWVNKGIDLCDFKFKKPKAWRIMKEGDMPDSQLSPDVRKKKTMWCPYMTPVKFK